MPYKKRRMTLKIQWNCKLIILFQYLIYNFLISLRINETLSSENKKLLTENEEINKNLFTLKSNENEFLTKVKINFIYFNSK